MAERSIGGVAHALRGGIARAASAPAVLLGTFAAGRVFDVPSANLSIFDRGARPVLVWVLFWSFAYGGVIDRFARDRPTRAYGFFGAAGAHAASLARLALIALAIEAALLPLLQPMTDTTAARLTLAAALLLASAIVAFARVRLVVEGRHSAIGSLFASVRFLRRNPSGIVLLCVFGLAAYGVSGVYQYLLSSGAVPDDWRGRASDEAFLAAQLWLKLTGYAAAVALFQSRLAHAGYTAAPPAVWPESASAEAIANASPRLAP